MTTLPLVLAQVQQPPVKLGPMDWGAVVLATVIIFIILGPRLLRDIRRKNP